VFLTNFEIPISHGVNLWQKQTELTSSTDLLMHSQSFVDKGNQQHMLQGIKHKQYLL